MSAASGPPNPTFRHALVGAMIYALTDSLHEFGHMLATLLPGQGVLTAISSVGISTSTSSPVVAAAGPAVNLLLGSAALLGAPRLRAATWQLVAWLFGTVNLFNGVAYLVYSAALGSGDWATVFAAIAPAAVWRPVTAVVGLLLYALVVVVATRRLCRGVALGRVDAAEAHDFSLTAYWAGGLLLTAAAALNPISPWLILTSGVATGFGAMAGLIVVAKRVRQPQPGEASGAPAIDFDRRWLIASATISLAFVVILGRGFALAT